jgi:hypothetical protein
MNKIKFFKPVYVNDVDALIPEIWANESIAILLENMVVANLVHRDFEDEIADLGDVVNIDAPAAFVAKRKGVNDNVTIQDATTTNVQVKLDQHFHVSFIIKDSESSKAFVDLVEKYLSPALQAHAQAIDKVILGQHINFMDNNAGGIGETTYANAVETLVDLRKVLNDTKCYTTGRNLIVGSALEATLLKDEGLREADKLGDDGSALREASLGRKLGFNIFMCQNMSETTWDDTNTATALQAAAAAGATELNVKTVANIAVGDMLLVAGDMTPQVVTAVTNTSASGADTVTISPGLRDAAADNAVVTIYDAVAVDETVTITTKTNSPGYDYFKIDGFTSGKYPQVGQQIKIGSYYYTIIDTDEFSDTQCDVLLDRPLEATVTDGDVATLYPAGNYGFAFHRNAIAFVSRPLAAPKKGVGALSAVANYDGIGVRVVITYDGDKQGHLVTVDLLCGVKTLNTNLGAVLLG